MPLLLSLLVRNIHTLLIQEAYAQESLPSVSCRSLTPSFIGRYSCIGKGLALMELRTVVALLILTFDVRLAPGETGMDLLTKSKDKFTISFADLYLMFSKRKGVEVHAPI
jgi:hypothetical protein